MWQPRESRGVTSFFQRLQRRLYIRIHRWSRLKKIKQNLQTNSICRSTNPWALINDSKVNLEQIVRSLRSERLMNGHRRGSASPPCRLSGCEKRRKKAFTVLNPPVVARSYHARQVCWLSVRATESSAAKHCDESISKLEHPLFPWPSYPLLWNNLVLSFEQLRLTCRAVRIDAHPNTKYLYIFCYRVKCDCLEFRDNGWYIRHRAPRRRQRRPGRVRRRHHRGCWGNFNFNFSIFLFFFTSEPTARLTVTACGGNFNRSLSRPRCRATRYPTLVSREPRLLESTRIVIIFVFFFAFRVNTTLRRMSTTWSSKHNLNQ